MVQHLWALTFLLGLVGSSTGLRLQSLDFFHSQMGLSHLVVDEAEKQPNRSIYALLTLLINLAIIYLKSFYV